MNKICKLTILRLTILLLLLPSILLSQKRGSPEHNMKRFPRIIDMLPKANKKMNSYVTGAAEARFMYSGKDDDTIQLNSETKPYFNSRYKFYRDSSGDFRFYPDPATEKSGLDIRVDPSQQLSLDQTPFQATMYIPSEGYRIDSIKTKKNYEDWLKRPRNLIDAMPVFISNNTHDTIFLEYQDLNAFMIQEALDEKGHWKPIERWQYSGCGNSYSETAILPGHLIVVKTIRYYGNFQTLLRIKLLNGKKISYSNTFKGSINREQFASEIRANKNFPDPFLNNLRH